MANKDTVRKLPISAIKSDTEKYKEVVNIDFEEEGKTYRVKLTPYFEPTRIDKLLQNFQKDIKSINDEDNLNFPDELIPALVAYYTVLEFSDFPRPKTDDIKKKIAYFTQVINTKYFKEVNEHLLSEEVSKIWRQIMEVMKTNEKLSHVIAKTQNEIQELKLQSPELRKRVQRENNQ